MSMIWRRYVKSTGYGPLWFYAALAVGFFVLAGWAIIMQDWLVATLALVMSVVAVAAVPVTRRLSRWLEASEENHRRE